MIFPMYLCKGNKREPLIFLERRIPPSFPSTTGWVLSTVGTYEKCLCPLSCFSCFLFLALSNPSHSLAFLASSFSACQILPSLLLMVERWLGCLTSSSYWAPQVGFSFFPLAIWSSFFWSALSFWFRLLGSGLWAPPIRSRPGGAWPCGCLWAIIRPARPVKFVDPVKVYGFSHGVLEWTYYCMWRAMVGLLALRQNSHRGSRTCHWSSAAGFWGAGLWLGADQSTRSGVPHPDMKNLM